ncbi:MAG: L-2-amino-thiazoline-4-carboxylic acid hydrolase [Desulfomonile sp.]|nr:L-2-amino-thiazoline-4-carboxylic acid hydrolase [Desulfomonile sp.]
MPEPYYPTMDGIWSKGLRQEPNFSKVRLETPYRKAVENFRKAIEGRTDFDPAVLFVWGTMQAKALLNTLKAIEETFGEQGQAVVRKAVNCAGYEALKEMLENSSFPEDCDEIELVSFIVTGLNCVLYASLERPWITSADRCEFDILWCPHQDIYSAFDCRVQRYFVEGMLDAIRDLGRASVTAAVEKLIPRGADCCHFVVDLLKDGGEQNPWHRYSEELAQRALEKLRK